MHSDQNESFSLLDSKEWFVHESDSEIVTFPVNAKRALMLGFSLIMPYISVCLKDSEYSA